jgi:hypothetical protein
VVFVPMMVAMCYHLFPSAPEAAGMRCSCAFHSHLQQDGVQFKHLNHT